MRKTYSLLAFLLLTLTRVAVAQDIIIADPQPVSQPAVQLPLPAADNLWLNEVRGRLDNMMYDRLLQNTQLGLLVYDLTAHQVVYQKNERQRMRPASVMKLVTSITALDMLGGDYQYHTGICYRGHLEGDTLVGDLYFVGGFDPTITRDDLRMMADTISRYGIHRIDGMLVSDLTMKDTLSYGSGWCWDDDNDRLTPLLVDKKDQFMSIMMQEMRARGIQLSVTLARGRLPQGCTEIYRYNSSIDKVLLRMMKQSDNLYAESMFYQVAKGNSPRTATASDASGAVKRLAMRLGLDPINYTIADGSGLSLYNYVSAEMIVALLRHAYQNREIYDHLYPSLPIAGVDGTLEKRMTKGKAFGNVHAKTGTVSGVSTLAGYCQASNGHTLCFAILNQGLIKASDGREYQDRVCEALCR
ncbi:MAG: D-alanyl-D-alanine carboxypeptidase/D-alanyl-D-alanine-endopeptidase [Prevotella sp.]|nr:D-alanyl-D-alanine carboxypeptidase/D-alanyl-D-alanine-endopeptidase [Prevotella sp.]MBR7054173.1 D-alanyl-D-alanine carboxypeptidase/D-alanyl-D-alanine-endopeptidase [Prevotella sp.]